MTDKTATKYAKRVSRTNRELREVKLGLMKVSPVSQCPFNKAWADELLANFDLDKYTPPEVNHRDGWYYIMNGQHSTYALKGWLGEGWKDQYVQCWVAEGLSEKEEAENFLGLNNSKAKTVFAKYKVALTAERPTESEVEKILQQQGLTTSTQQVPGAISAVGTLLRAYKRDGGHSLARALKIAHEAWGDPGLDSAVIDGFSMMSQRYNGILDENSSIHALGNLRGGVKGLLGQAEQLRLKTGASKSQCVAAAAVVVINRDRTGKTHKLASWFK